MKPRVHLSVRNNDVYNSSIIVVPFYESDPKMCNSIILTETCTHGDAPVCGRPMVGFRQRSMLWEPDNDVLSKQYCFCHQQPSYPWGRKQAKHMNLSMPFVTSINGSMASVHANANLANEYDVIFVMTIIFIGFLLLGVAIFKKCVCFCKD